MLWTFSIHQELLAIQSYTIGFEEVRNKIVWHRVCSPSGLMGLAGGPHYVGLFAGYTSYLLNVSFCIGKHPNWTIPLYLFEKAYIDLSHVLRNYSQDDT